eukprot:scaffold1223_cov380-Prasinococcus_capsulatus_cf.AAC.9
MRPSGVRPSAGRQLPKPRRWRSAAPLSTARLTAANAGATCGCCTGATTRRRQEPTQPARPSRRGPAQHRRAVFGGAERSGEERVGRAAAAQPHLPPRGGRCARPRSALSARALALTLAPAARRFLLLLIVLIVLIVIIVSIIIIIASAPHTRTARV